VCVIGRYEKNVDQRLEEATRNGNARSSCIQVVQLHQVLRSALLTNPARLLCGVSEDETHVHLMVSYNDILNNSKISVDRSLVYKIPMVPDE